MKMYKLFILLQIFLTFSLSAQTNKAEKLSKFITKALETIPIVPAVSVAVVDESGVVFAKGFGYADIENQILATAQTNFYIASCTKSFNGLLATILAEEGRINLNEQITSYKPFNNFKNKEIFQNITIMDLLSHQSGIENTYLTFKLAYSGDYTDKEIRKLIEEETRPNEVGKIFAYTNLGYYLLDELLQAELGESWQDLLQKKLFQPLNMKKTTAYISKTEKEELALPYLGAFPQNVRKAYLMKSDETMHAAGGLVCNAEDVAKYLLFYINKGKVDTVQVYSEELVEQTCNKQISVEGQSGSAFDGHGYATGWVLGKYHQDELVFHYGAYAGFRSNISFLPQKKIGVAVFINHEFAMPFVNLIVKYTYDMYLGNESSLKNHEKTLEEDLKKLLNRYQQRELEHEKRLAKPSWQLSLPKEKYSGVFHNEKISTVRIVYENEDLVVSCGNLMAVATPSADKDCIRIELISGSEDIIYFNLKNEEISSIYYRDETFDKIK